MGIRRIDIGPSFVRTTICLGNRLSAIVIGIVVEGVIPKIIIKKGVPPMSTRLNNIRVII
jgi:hypothetical protein